jgi:hypothetical protein
VARGVFEFRRALRTNWISFEIDKLVSTIYFLILLILITVALNNQSFINDVFRSFGFSENSTKSSHVSSSNQSSNTSENSTTPTTQLFLENEGLKLALLIILIISIIAIGVTLLFGVRSAMWNSQLLVMLFYSSDSEAVNEAIQKFKDAFMQSLKERDWGMASFYSAEIRKYIMRPREP